jgi:S-formylglutathione hydrolase FrmB
MADMRIKFLATSVQMQMHLGVFLPDAAIAASDSIPASGLKTLWLLHDAGGDDSDWMRLSMVEHYAQAAGVALIMPSMDNSMYMDMAYGGYPYFRYLTEDLPNHVRNLVGVLSVRPEDNYVAGVGVGGYGALKWALRFPDAFAAAAAFSAPIDIVGALRRQEDAGGLANDWAAAFGSAAAVEGTPDDLLLLARGRSNSAPTALYVDAGLADEASLPPAFAPLKSPEAPDMAGWPYWDSRIRAFIDDIVLSAEAR